MRNAQFFSGPGDDNTPDTPDDGGHLPDDGNGVDLGEDWGDNAPDADDD